MIKLPDNRGPRPRGTIKIVSDEACPGCGAFWGHPDPALDFPNRVKVDADWKCYNPDCEVGFYRDGQIVELKPTPEERERIEREAAEWVKRISFGKTWKETSPGTWTMVPEDEVMK